MPQHTPTQHNNKKKETEESHSRDALGGLYLGKRMGEL
jgi:hypothetical protein